jgi:27-O-demethylrifamycin SV methyltransferase
VTTFDLTPASHYDRISDAWQLVLGDDLHHGVFADRSTNLRAATRELTRLMRQTSGLTACDRVIDVGSGIGGPACQLALDTGASVLGITTSAVGVERARQRALNMEVDGIARFEQRDALDTQLPSESFDVVWLLESPQYLVPHEEMMRECARLLAPGGRLALCDVMLQRPLAFRELRRLHDEIGVLRDVFGEAQMKTLESYLMLAERCGLEVTTQVDLTERTRPTYARWRERAHCVREDVVQLVGEATWQRFIDGCDVMERFSREGHTAYALLGARKPA